jgi:hypothetical protein
VLLAKRIRNVTTGISHRVNLRIYLGRDGLAVCVVSGRLRPVVQMKAFLPITTSDSGGTHGITAALNVLSSWLHTHPLRATIDWVLGIDHVRYLLLPWDDRLSSRSFCHTLAAALFSQQFSGSEIPYFAYRVRFAPLSYGRPLLAALVTSQATDELKTFASGHHCRTRWIATSLSVVWDRFFVRVKGDTGVLALVEGPRLLRVTYDHGHVMSLSVQPFSEKLTPSIPGGATHRFPARNLAEPADNECALRGVPADTDARFAYALCGRF